VNLKLNKSIYTCLAARTAHNTLTGAPADTLSPLPTLLSYIVTLYRTWSTRPQYTYFTFRPARSSQHHLLAPPSSSADKLAQTIKDQQHSTSGTQLARSADSRCVADSTNVMPPVMNIIIPMDHAS